MAKKTKTPAQRAQEQYDVADRKVARLQKKHEDAKALAESADVELQAAVTERNAYARLRDALDAGPKRAVVAETPPMNAEEGEK